MLTYPRWRPWCLTWGATDAEAAMALPGDELLEDPDVVTTRAIGIDVPPSTIWPWIVQMGPGRAGAYTYDWIENLAGLDMHSVDELLPQFQDISVGDGWRLGMKGPRLEVARLDQESALVLRSDDGNWVWAFVLVPDGQGTRLLSRNRIRQPGASATTRALTTYLMEPGSLVMERKMLLGIKERAERGAGPAGRHRPDQALRPPATRPRRPPGRPPPAAEDRRARRHAGGRGSPGSGSTPAGTPARAPATASGRRTPRRPHRSTRRGPGSAPARRGRATTWRRGRGNRRTGAC